MKVLRATMAVFTLATLAVPAAAVAARPDPAARTGPAHGADRPQAVPGSYIVSLRSGSPDKVSDRHARKYGAGVDHVYRSALRGYSARMSPVAAAKIADDPDVAKVVPDQVVTADGLSAKRPGPGPDPSPAAQLLPFGIDRIDGDLSSAITGDGSGSSDVDVAIIDTGISAHPDLNVVGGHNCQRGKSWEDQNGHGTHVAGTVAARDDAVGVVGVVPGARLHAVRVLDRNGSGSWSSVICGIDWVAANADEIEVANMSLGGPGLDTGVCLDGGMHQAICRATDAGVTFVVAAGNDAEDSAGHVPAAYDEVVTVSALADFDGRPGGLGSPSCREDRDDTFADFSNFGADVDLIAPGVCITSTWLNGGYRAISGTSMASPHVAGAAALYLSGHPEARPAQVKQALQSAGNQDWSADDDPDGDAERLLDVDVF